MTDRNTENSIRVLYVEDEKTLQDVVSEYLEAIGGYEVVCANDGQQGVEKALSWKPDFILMDVRMPVMNGIEATRVLRQTPETSATMIYALTAYSDEQTLAACEEAGINGYFTKPPNFHLIISTIRKKVASVASD
ncbi:response regulator [Chloroflexota bacterium]